MKCDHIEAWRAYLITQMRDKYGVTKREAGKAVAGWLRSLEQNPAGRKVYPVSKPLHKSPPNGEGRAKSTFDQT